MSLINEALKKAQRQRLEEGADPTDPSSPTTGRMPRRGKPQSTNTVVLLGSAGLVLVVLSVVFTVYLVNRPTDTKRVAATSPAAAPAAKATPAGMSTSSAPDVSAPPIVVPKIAPISSATSAPAATPTDTPTAQATSAAANSSATSAARLQPAATIAATPSAPASAAPISTSAAPAIALPATPPPTPEPTPATTASAPASPVPAASTLPPGVPDERVAAFVESIRVTGIRSSGAESRVLMNERVYRVNDVVERNLGVRLVKAAADSLTFSDPRGVTYVKNF